VTHACGVLLQASCLHHNKQAGHLYHKWRAGKRLRHTPAGSPAEYTGDNGRVQEGDRVVNEGLNKLIGQEVVLDTAGPWVYLGVLTAFDEQGFWLEQADVHNVQEGHATREQYVAESSRDGIRVNRQRVFVLRNAVASLSGLADVVKD